MLVAEHGKPWPMRVDNGSEMTGQLFVDWCCEEVVEFAYTQHGKSDQSAYIQRFSRLFRTEILEANILISLGQIRELAWAWLLSYNEEQPYAALGNIPPAECKGMVTVGSPGIPLRA